MKLKKPTLLLAGAAALLIGLVAPVLWDAWQPLTGDWKPDLSEKNGRAEVRLVRIMVLPWSQAIPIVEEYQETFARGMGYPGPEDLFLFIEVEMDVDGEPVRRGPEGPIESVGQLEISYNGKRSVAKSSVALVGHAPNRFAEIRWPIEPWHRGIGTGEFVVDFGLTLKPAEKFEFRFQVPAR